MTILFASQPRRIGRREWRVIVCHYNEGDGGPFIDYEWRYPAYQDLDKAGPWENMTTYPGYDSNDGTWAGCPKTLRTLYSEQKGDIAAAMGKEGSK